MNRWKRGSLLSLTLGSLMGGSAAAQEVPIALHPPVVVRASGHRLTDDGPPPEKAPPPMQPMEPNARNQGGAAAPHDAAAVDPSAGGMPTLVGAAAACNSCRSFLPGTGRVATWICGEPRTPSDVDEPSWFRFESLISWFRDFSPPALVSSGPQASLGILSNGAGPIYGGSGIDEGEHFGFRISAGAWLETSQFLGMEGSFFVLFNNTASFQALSSGNPLLARPFFNALTGADDAVQVANLMPPGGGVLPTVGGVLVTTGSRLEGIDFNLTSNVCRGRGGRLDVLGGFRYVQLNEYISINDFSAVPAGAPALAGLQYQREDVFDTRNLFFGPQVGVKAEWHRGRWTLGANAKLAVGWMEQLAQIDGVTVIGTPGTQVLGPLVINLPPTVYAPFPGGVLAQPSNIGNRNRSKFAFLPELGLNVGYNFRPGLRAFVGYDFMYLSNVLRPDDLIDVNVNPNQFAPSVAPLAGPFVPQPQYKQTSFWAQGITLGIELKY
jgi:hypothetical protein